MHIYILFFHNENQLPALCFDWYSLDIFLIYFIKLGHHILNFQIKKSWYIKKTFIIWMLYFLVLEANLESCSNHSKGALASFNL